MAMLTLKRHTWFASLFLAAGLLFDISTETVAANSKQLSLFYRQNNIILETDLGSSTDDLVTLELLCKINQRPDYTFLGVMVDRPNDQSIGMDIPRLADQVMYYHGCDEVPIGVVPPDNVDRTVFCPYWKLAYSNNVADTQGQMRDSGTFANRTNDVVRLYRQLMSDADPIDICAIGFLSNISNLLDSAGDDISELTGRELVLYSSSTLRIMMGSFSGELSHPEYNCWGDVASAKYVLANWPGKIVIVPYEVGLKVYYPRKMLLEDFSNAGLTGDPLYLAYKNWDPDDGPFGLRRKSQLMWDPMTLLGALADNKIDDDDGNELLEGCFEYSAPGRVNIVTGADGNDGYTEFTPDPKGNVVIQSLRTDKARYVLNYMRNLLTNGRVNMDTVDNGSRLRVHSVYSHTASSNGDDGEFIVLTNTSYSASMSLAGVRVECCEPECAASMVYEFPAGTAALAPCASVKITRANCWPSGHINNGATNIILFDADGDVIQEVFIDSRWFGGAAAGTGCFTVLNNFEDLVIDKEHASVLPLTDHGECVRIADGLYEIDYSRYDYADAQPAAGISAQAASRYAGSDLGVGRYFGRNFDGTRNDGADFVIAVPADTATGRHSSIGIAHYGFPTNEAMFAALPFYMTDGINDAGIAISADKVPSGDIAGGIGTYPQGERLDDIAIVRFVLDNAANIGEAIELIRRHKIYSSEFHYFISDPEVSVVVESVDGQTCVVTNRIMTNFYLSQSAEEYTPHARGIERLELLQAHSNEVTSVESLFNVMTNTYCSKLWIDPDNVTNRWSDFNGQSDLSGKDFSFEQSDSRNSASEKYMERTKLAEWLREQWRTANDYYRCTGEWPRSSIDQPSVTIHSAVYDLREKELYVRAKERPTTFRFDLAGDWRNNLTSVYVNGDMVGPASSSNFAVEKTDTVVDYGWSFDPDRNELFLTGNGCYDVEGLVGSGITLREGQENVIGNNLSAFAEWAFRSGYSRETISNAKTLYLSAALRSSGLLDDVCEEEGWPRISGFTVTPSNAVITVEVPANATLVDYYESIGMGWNLLSADQDLLKEAIGVIGAESPGGEFSADNVNINDIDIMPDAVKLTVKPANEDAENFFYKAMVR